MAFYLILQPTRVTQNTSTVIDNIFSNNIQDDIISGNVLLNLSDHFAQMVSVNREQIDTKKINMYQRDYSKFSSKSFRDDVSIQNWCYSRTARGGVAIYVRDEYNVNERNDLNLVNNSFEAAWVEIKNTKAKNIVCGCIYKYPKSDNDDLNIYISKCLAIINK